MNTDYLTSAFKRLRIRLRLDSAGGDNDEIADDLLDAFCRLWTQKNVLKDGSHAEGLLMKTARNIRIDRFRRVAAHPSASLGYVVDMPTETDESYADRMELYDAVDRLAAQKLSERDREILFHRERDGWSFTELAETYGLTEGNVRMIVSRSRKTLRDIYLKQNV